MAKADCGESWVNVATDSQCEEMKPMKMYAQKQSKMATDQSDGKRKTQKSKKMKEKMKCIWCDNTRERHDLCGRCRQKVESRARRIMLQKINGDWLLFDEVGQLVNQHCSNVTMTCSQLLSLLSQIGPFWYLLRQAKKTYVAKRSLQPWTLPDSSILQLIQDLYLEKNEIPALNGTVYEIEKLHQLDRKSLCQMLEEKVFDILDNFQNDNKHIRQYGNDNGSSSSHNNGAETLFNQTDNCLQQYNSIVAPSMFDMNGNVFECQMEMPDMHRSQASIHSQISHISQVTQGTQGTQMTETTSSTHSTHSTQSGQSTRSVETFLPQARNLYSLSMEGINGNNVIGIEDGCVGVMDDNLGCLADFGNDLKLPAMHSGCFGNSGGSDHHDMGLSWSGLMTDMPDFYSGNRGSNEYQQLSRFDPIYPSTNNSLNQNGALPPAAPQTLSGMTMALPMMPAFDLNGF